MSICTCTYIAYIFILILKYTHDIRNAVCSKAKVTTHSYFKVRKWLASLLRGSLLHENPNGIHVHGRFVCVCVHSA